ncbi:SubName: Full=Uncharacterized protein {ECO:0000313/EMBL:CCA72327.1} [Serendipita indica DSM 11827]|nr:SubName: Full=Uncharacterized protein {ECO:0000313/EMBL:CCA72327.1} [Serendipita indica DSM 11827]
MDNRMKRAGTKRERELSLGHQQVPTKRVKGAPTDVSPGLDPSTSPDALALPPIKASKGGESSNKATNFPTRPTSSLTTNLIPPAARAYHSYDQLNRRVDSSFPHDVLIGPMTRHKSPVRSPSPAERAFERRRQKSMQGPPVSDNPGQEASSSHSGSSTEPAHKPEVAKMSQEEREEVLSMAESLFGVSDAELDRHQKALGFVTHRQLVEKTWKKGEPLPYPSGDTGGSGYFSASTAPSDLLASIGWKFDQLRKGEPIPCDRYQLLDLVAYRPIDLEGAARAPPSPRDNHRRIENALRHAQKQISPHFEQNILIPSHWGEPVAEYILLWYDSNTGPKDHQPLKEPIPKKLPLTDPINASPAQATTFILNNPEEEEGLADADGRFDVMASPPRKQHEAGSAKPRHFIESELLRRKVIGSLAELGNPMVMAAVFKSKEYKEIRATSRRLYQYYKNKMRLQSILTNARRRDKHIAGLLRYQSATSSRRLPEAVGVGDLRGAVETSKEDTRALRQLLLILETTVTNDNGGSDDEIENEDSGSGSEDEDVADPQTRLTEMNVEQKFGPIFSGYFKAGFKTSSNAEMNLIAHMRQFGISPHPDLQVVARISALDAFPNLLPVIMVAEAKKRLKTSYKAVQNAFTTLPIFDLFVRIYLHTRGSPEEAMPPWMYTYGIVFAPTGFEIYAHFVTQVRTRASGIHYVWEPRSTLVSNEYAMCWRDTEPESLERFRVAQCLYHILSHTFFVNDQVSGWIEIQAVWGAKFMDKLYAKERLEAKDVAWCIKQGISPSLDNV